MTTQRRHLKFFLAHPASYDDEAIARFRAQLERLTPATVETFRTITVARDDFEKRCRDRMGGNWQAWAEEVASGVDYRSRQPLFDVIVVAEGLLGRITAVLVNAACAAGKPVFQLSADGSALTRVARAICPEGRDKRNQWEVMVVQ